MASITLETSELISRVIRRDLSELDLRNTDFSKANFRNTDLRGVILTGTDLRGAIGLTAWRAYAKKRGAIVDA